MTKPFSSVLKFGVALLLLLCSISSRAQLLLDFSKVTDAKSYGFYVLSGGGDLQTDNQSRKDTVSQFAFGIKYGAALTRAKLFHYTFTAGYEVIRGLEMPVADIVSSYTLGEFTAEALFSWSVGRTLYPDDTNDFPIDLSLWAGGKLGFPALKDAQGVYSGRLYATDVIDTTYKPNDPISVAMTSSMPITYHFLGGWSIALPFISKVLDVAIFGQYNYVSLPFSNVAYSLQDGKQVSAIPEQLPHNFSTTGWLTSYGLSMNIPLGK